jgi:hypothetical protein
MTEWEAPNMLSWQVEAAEEASFTAVRSPTDDYSSSVHDKGQHQKAGHDRRQNRQGWGQGSL